MGAIHSARFLLGGTPGQSIAYTVPTGKRASVKSVFVANNGSSTALVGVDVAGVNVWVSQVPATTSRELPDTTIVAYAGEVLSFYTGNSSVNVCLSGFLFDEPTTLSDDHGTIQGGVPFPPSEAS